MHGMKTVAHGTQLHQIFVLRYQKVEREQLPFLKCAEKCELNRAVQLSILYCSVLNRPAGNTFCLGLYIQQRNITKI